MSKLSAQVLPNFLVIGAPKAATTSLCSVLADHPQVFMFPAKETHFFNREFDRGIDWYSNLFRPRKTEMAIGEGTPNYADGSEDVVTRIATHLPATN